MNPDIYLPIAAVGAVLLRFGPFERIAHAESTLLNSERTRDLANAKATRVRAFCGLAQLDDAPATKVPSHH